MPINSIIFLSSFIPFILVYYSIRNVRWQNLLLALASAACVVYANHELSLLVLALTLATYLAAARIACDRHRKLWLWLGSGVSVGTLVFFKYNGFFVPAISRAVEQLGFDGSSISILMPVGISYFVFRQISYMVDVYRGELASSRHFGDYVAFSCLFSNFLSGPIDKAKNFMPQLAATRRFSRHNAVLGSRQVLWGMVKKMVVADNLAVIVNGAWTDLSQHSSLNLLVVGALYAIQLYMDFSGYSDMAIGVGKMMGFDVNRNFLYPLFSRNIAELWRRWHISLTSWFTNYLYFSLGGSRRGKWCAIANTVIVFTVCGAWHGATLNYVLWGLFNGLLFIPLILSGSNKKYKGQSVAESRLLPSLAELGSMLLTFWLFAFGLYIFHSEDLGDFALIMEGLLCNWTVGEAVLWDNYCNLALVVLAVEWLARRHEFPLAGLTYRHSAWVNVLLYVALIELILRYGSFVSQGFIYGNY